MTDDLKFSTAIMVLNAIFYLFTFMCLLAVNNKVLKLRKEMKERESLDRELMKAIKNVIEKIK